MKESKFIGTGVSSGDSNNLWLAPKIQTVNYDNLLGGGAIQQIAYKICDTNTYSSHDGVLNTFTYSFTLTSDQVTNAAVVYYMKPWKATIRYYWADNGAEATDSATLNKIDETQSVTDAERDIAVCPTSPDADKHSCLAKKMIRTLREGESYNRSLDPL
jgi:hypothetical protein